MADIRPLTHEETIATLDARSKQENLDSFRLRIQRRSSPTHPPIIYALFEDAQVAHFATPETWLPRLVGPGAGGIFEIMAYHAANPNMTVGGVIKIPIEGESRPPMIEVVTFPGWDGPKRLSFPKPSDQQNSPGVGLPSHIMGGTGVDQTQRRDPVTGLPPPNPPLSQNQQPPFMPGMSLGPDPREEALARRQREIDAESQKLREAQSRAEIMNTVKAQIDSVLDLVKQSQSQMAAQTSALLAQQSQPKGPSVTEIVTALAPVLATFIQTQQQARADDAKRTELLLTTMMSRPSVDPAVQMMIDRMVKQMEDARSKPDAAAEMISQMSGAMAAMTNTTMQLVHTAAELSSGGAPPAEPAWVKVIREGAKAFVGVAQAQAQVAASAAAGGVRMAPPAVQPQALPPEQAKLSALEVIENAIKKHKPVAKVAAAILNNLEDESIQTALSGVGGDIEALFRNRLGAWLMVPANITYVTALRAEIEKQAQARGLAGDPATLDGADPGDPSDAEEGEDDGEEGDGVM